jgi:MFS family permease
MRILRKPAQLRKIGLRGSRRAFLLNVLNGGFFLFAETLMDPTVVLVWFVSQLTTSNFLIGSVSTISSAGWFLPQLFLSGWLQTKARKMPVYRAAAVVRVISWAGLVATLWFNGSETFLLVGFFITFAVMKLMSGLAGIPFMEVTAKTIPMERRGRLFGLRFFLGGVLGLLGTRIVARVLDDGLSFPRNYAFLIFLAMLLGGAALFVFSLTREPEGPTRQASSVGGQLRRGWQALRENRDYRNLLIGRAFLFLGFIVIPFYTVLAQRQLQAPPEAVGYYLALTTFTNLVVNYPWGWLLDRKGMRWGMRAVSLGWGVTALLALILSVAAHLGGLQGLPMPLYATAFPLFFLRGLFTPVGGIAGQNLLLEVAPEDDRSLYLGFGNTILGIVLLLSSVGGLLMDLLGIQALFAVAVIMNLLAFFFFGRVRLRRS